jgi:hypothetical protein
MDLKVTVNSDEISPLTGDKTVMVDKDPATGLTSKLCFKSGFTTNSFLIEGSKTVQDLNSQLPKIATDLQIIDKLGWVWIPMMQNTEDAVIYPVGIKEDWKWQVSPLNTTKKKVKEDKDFNPNDPGNYMTVEVDYENAKDFTSDQFEKAFEYFINYSSND